MRKILSLSILVSLIVGMKAATYVSDMNDLSAIKRMIIVNEKNYGFWAERVEVKHDHNSVIFLSRQNNNNNNITCETLLPTIKIRPFDTGKKLKLKFRYGRQKENNFVK